MADITEILQRMMQSNMQLPNLQRIPIPGMGASLTTGSGASQTSQPDNRPSLFDAIKAFKSGGGASLIRPQMIGDQALSGPPALDGPTSENGNPLFQGNRMQAVALQRPVAMGSQKGGAVG
jgi:hypothetical protein